jgi:hypothetical protein
LATSLGAASKTYCFSRSGWSWKWMLQDVLFLVAWGGVVSRRCEPPWLEQDEDDIVLFLVGYRKVVNAAARWRGKAKLLEFSFTSFCGFSAARVVYLFKKSNNDWN